MDPHSFIARAEAQRWLGIAEKLLMGHDIVGSKTFAIRARESDPRLEAADQILAIADTLLAAEKRVVGNNGAQQPDFYAILQLVRFVQDTEHIGAQYRRLALMLNPHQNRFPYSDQAFQLVNDAWAVLSNPMRKSMYDAELNFPPPQQQMNTIGFNLEQQHHHHHHQQQQQQQQHNFFSIPNHIGSGHEQELPEPPQTFQIRAQQSHQQQQLQQHNFLSQSNPIRPVPVREQEQLFQPQVQPFVVKSPQHQQSRPPPQPPQPQPPMQTPPPPPPAAPTQPTLSWSQAPSLSQPLQLQQPVPHKKQAQQTQPQPQPVPQKQQLQQPQPQPQPQEQPQPQPQPQPQTVPQKQQIQQPQPQKQQPQQPQQQRQQQQLQQEPQTQQPQRQQEQQQPQQQSREQNVAPVQKPLQVNHNNGVREERREKEAAAETQNVNESSTFWTACPFCYYMYEYPRVYAECTLRCDNCKRAFQAVPVQSPPPIIEGKEAYFCCWGFFPLGVSMSHLEKKKGTGTGSRWAPFSPLNAAPSNVQDHLNGRAAPKPNFNAKKSSGPRIYIDDFTDDVFMGIPEPSDDSDVEWGSTSKKKKGKRMKKKGLGYKKAQQVLGVKPTGAKRGRKKKVQDGISVQEGAIAPTAAVAESSKKTVGANPRRQSGRVAKELGKLDLNVEFNNNEGEEPAPGMTAGNRGGHGHGEEDNIEGIGFFEGLDEFLSSLPILSVVNDEKVKAA